MYNVWRTRTISMKYEELWNQYLEAEKNYSLLSHHSWFKTEPTVQALIDEGIEMVPFLFDKLREEPKLVIVYILGQLKSKFSLGLYEIVKPEHAGRLNEITKDWLSWYDRTGAFIIDLQIDTVQWERKHFSNNEKKSGFYSYCMDVLNGLY